MLVLFYQPQTSKSYSVLELNLDIRRIVINKALVSSNSAFANTLQSSYSYFLLYLGSDYSLYDVSNA